MSGAVVHLHGLDERHQSKISDLLQRDSVFAALSPGRRQRLAESGTIVRLEKGQKLFGHGDRSDAAFAIFVGEVEITIPGLDGRPVWLARIKSGSVIGEMGALDGTPRVTHAHATRRCELLRMDARLIREAILAEPVAALAMISMLARRLRETDSLVERTSSMELGKRLARFLLTESTHGRILYNQSEIARHISSSREAVNRKLEQWRRAKWIEISKTGLHVHDRAALLGLCRRGAKPHI